MLALGELLFETGRRRDAGQAWARLLAVEPKHPGGLYYQGALLAEHERYPEAIERWDQVIAIDPDGSFAARARRDRRTAADLARIFVRRPDPRAALTPAATASTATASTATASTATTGAATAVPPPTVAAVATIGAPAARVGGRSSGSGSRASGSLARTAVVGGR